MYKAVIIGGSAGSFQIVTRILSALPVNYPIPVILVMHRLKHVKSGFVEALSIKSAIPVKEPADKDKIKPGIAYLAPSNYHMLVKVGSCFALTSGEPVNYSRPSIDLAFISAAQYYRNSLIGLILSGANKDGAQGLKTIKEHGGTTIVQDPEQSQVSVMIRESMKLTQVDYVFDTDQIIAFLLKIKPA